MEIKTEMIAYPSNEHKSPGYLARPDMEGKFPAIVAIQEWWGLEDHIKDVAERFAKQGYITLAPDLYHGKIATEPDEARKLAMALDREQAIEEISAAVKYLKGMDSVSPKKIGVVGWCMGGALCLTTSATNTDIGATVVFYGRPLEAKDTANIQAPVLGLYGEADQGIPISLVQDFERELDNNNILNDIHVYPAAPHAFFNDSRPHIYDDNSAKDAWKRTINWFQKHLT